MTEKLISKNIPNWFINAVQPTDNYELLLTFHDGSYRSFDFKPLLSSPLFCKLKSLTYFAKAHLEGHSVVWDDDTDIASEYLYEHSKKLN